MEINNCCGTTCDKAKAVGEVRAEAVRPVLELLNQARSEEWPFKQAQLRNQAIDYCERVIRGLI